MKFKLGFSFNDSNPQIRSTKHSIKMNLFYSNHLGLKMLKYLYTTVQNSLCFGLFVSVHSSESTDKKPPFLNCSKMKNRFISFSLTLEHFCFG